MSGVNLLRGFVCCEGCGTVWIADRAGFQLVNMRRVSVCSSCSTDEVALRPFRRTRPDRVHTLAG